MPRPTFEEGSYVYSCSYRDGRPIVERFVVLQNDGRSVQLGHSKRPSSSVRYSPIEILDDIYASSHEAVNNCLVRTATQFQDEMEDLDAKKAKLGQRLDDLLATDLSTIEVQSYPDDYEPVDF